MKNLFMWSIFIACSVCDFKAQIAYPGDNPGQAIFKKLPDNEIILENDVIRIQFSNADGKIRIKSFENKKPYEQVNLGNTTK